MNEAFTRVKHLRTGNSSVIEIWYPCQKGCNCVSYQSDEEVIEDEVDCHAGGDCCRVDDIHGVVHNGHPALLGEDLEHGHKGLKQKAKELLTILEFLDRQ